MWVRAYTHTPLPAAAPVWVTTPLAGAMFFNAGELQPSHVELLLNRLDAAAASVPAGSAAQQGGSSADFVEEAPPTLTDFLDEDDLLPECRSENARLIDYLCKQEQLLVRLWGRRVGVAAVGSRFVACARNERCFLCLRTAATTWMRAMSLALAYGASGFACARERAIRRGASRFAPRHGKTQC